MIKRQKIAQGSSAMMLQTLQTQPVSEHEIASVTALTEERDKQIAELEKGMTEINGLMIDVAYLVNQQAEKVDSIADHIEKAVTHTDKGVKELEKAAEYQRSWKCCVS